MSDLKRIDDLDISQDFSFQKQEWKFERVGWVVMAAIIVLALLGLFGDGWLSSTTQSGPDGVNITYKRFDRRNSPSDLSVQVPSELISEGQIRIWISRDYLENVQIDGITPNPGETLADEDRIVFVFDAIDSDEPISVEFELTIESPWTIDGEVGWGDDSSISFTQFVFP